MKTINNESIIFFYQKSNLKDQFIAYVIKNEIGIECILLESMNELNNYSVAGKKTMMLYNCDDKKIIEILFDIESNKVFFSNFQYFALFNLHKNQLISKKFFELGIKGCFFSDDHIDDFFSGIQALFRNKIWLPSSILLNVDNYEVSFTIAKEKFLTQREIYLLLLLKQGLNNKEIAGKSFISLGTVKTHFNNIFKKLNVRNRLQAIIWIEKNLQ